MAKMYPSPTPASLKQDPARHGEWRLFNALESGTSAAFSAFYSVGWVTRNSHYASDGEADFVIAHADKGVLVIEVKGGIISYDGTADQYFSMSRSGGSNRKIKDPAAQAVRSKFALIAKIAELPGWKHRDYPFAHAVCFPHTVVGRADLHPELPRAIVIDAEDLLDIDACLGRIYEYWHSRQPGRSEFGGDGIAMLHQLLAPSWTLRFPLAQQLNGYDTEIRKLSDRQVAVLRGMSRSRRKAIEGGAGTGKTVLAIAKARHLAAQGFRVLLTCFNRLLAEHLRMETAGTPNLEVNNFHQLCVDMAAKAQIPIEATGEKHYFDHVLPEALLAACGRIDFRYDAIVVDEGQDFQTNFWLPLQCCLQEPDHGIFYIFFDNNQAIFGEVALPDGLANDPYLLTENFRNTRQIHAASVPYYEPPAGGDHMESRGPDGDVVFMRAVNDGEELTVTVARLLERLIDDRIEPGNIVVLSGRSLEGKSQFANLNRLGRVELTRDSVREPAKVLVSSISRFKGLERQVVILTEIDDLLEARRTSSLYVGLTRARLYLVIVAREATLQQLKARVKPEVVTA